MIIFLLEESPFSQRFYWQTKIFFLTYVCCDMQILSWTIHSQSLCDLLSIFEVIMLTMTQINVIPEQWWPALPREGRYSALNASSPSPSPREIWLIFLRPSVWFSRGEVLIQWRLYLCPLHMRWCWFCRQVQESDPAKIFESRSFCLLYL